MTADPAKESPFLSYSPSLHIGRPLLKHLLNWTWPKCKLEFMTSPKCSVLPPKRFSSRFRACPAQTQQQALLHRHSHHTTERGWAAAAWKILFGNVSDTRSIQDKISELDEFDCDTSWFWGIHYTAISLWQLLAFKDWSSGTEERSTRSYLSSNPLRGEASDSTVSISLVLGEWSSGRNKAFNHCMCLYASNFYTALCQLIPSDKAHWEAALNLIDFVCSPALIDFLAF